MSDAKSGEVEGVSLCMLMVGEETFAIDTKKIREVLGAFAMQKIPLAPVYVAGVIPNRGEVLTTVSLRALLGLEERVGASAVLVLEDEDEDERFGLMVDEVSSVLKVSAETLEANPSTLVARSRALFDGAYKLQTGLMVRLDTAKLHPSRLKSVGLFTDDAITQEAGRRELECEH
jgi:purine-binding chemotaxis protein CheW